MRFLPVALVLACSVSLAAAPVPKAVKKKFPDYYPLVAGSTWEYDMGGTEVTIRVKEVEEKDGAKTAKLVTEHQGKEVATETIRVDATGVSRTEINGTKVDPELLILKFGLADEDEWEVKSNVQASKVAGKFTLKGTEKLKTKAGQFEPVVVKADCDIAGTATSVQYWFADGVGIVKLQYSIAGNASAPLELKKYTPGK